MKKAILSCICLLCLLIMAGCAPTLKDYVKRSSNYSNQVAATTAATVNIEPNKVVHTKGMGKTLGAIGSVVNTASGIASMALSNEQSARLNKLIVPQHVGVAMADGFNQGFEGTTHLQVVDKSANPDLRIMLTVNDYGLWAESLASPMNFYVEAEIRVIYAPEMETIYTNGATIMRSVSDILSEMANAANMEIYVSGHLSRTQYATFGAINNVGHLAKGAANLAAFFKLTDQEIVTIFDYLSYDAGTAIATQLVDDIYR